MFSILGLPDLISRVLLQLALPSSVPSPLAASWNERSVLGAMTVAMRSTHYPAWKKGGGLQKAAESGDEKPTVEFKVDWDSTQSAMHDFNDELDGVLACIAHDIDLEWQKS